MSISLVDGTRLLKALADETRLRILHMLQQGELSVSDLMEVLNLGQSRTSTHLTMLKEVGLVTEVQVPPIGSAHGIGRSVMSL